MNAVQPARRGAAAVSQTVNPHLAPQPELAQLHAQADRRVWFCGGAYAQAGIPLLESAVRSARTVAQRLAGLRSDGMPGAQD